MINIVFSIPLLAINAMGFTLINQAAHQTYNNLGYLWLLAAIFLLFMELTAPGLFFFISFSIGCLVASILAFWSYSITIQCTGCLMGSIVAFFILHAIFIKKDNQKYKTNIQALVQQEAIITSTIEPHKVGQVKVKGEKWPAVSDSHIILHKDTIVTITKIKGNKLIVSNKKG